MNNDLISREALRNVILNDSKLDGANANWEVNRILVHIDNAPTISPFKPMCKAKDEAICEEMTTDGHCNYSKPCPNKEERPQGEWIPISERLPEKIGTYLVTLEYKEHGQGITTLWYHGEGIGWDLRVADVVTAWRPLPKPYKEGGAE